MFELGVVILKDVCCEDFVVGNKLWFSVFLF